MINEFLCKNVYREQTRAVITELTDLLPVCWNTYTVIILVKNSIFVSRLFMHFSLLSLSLLCTCAIAAAAGGVCVMH